MDQSVQIGSDRCYDGRMPDDAFARMAPERRDRLVTAAAHEFAAHPGPEASLNRIIAACGMSKSSFYHVIDSKEALLGIVVTTLTERAKREWTPPSPEDFASDFWTTAEGVWAEATEVWPRGEALGLLWRIVWAEPEHPSVRAFHEAVGAWLESVLAIGRDAGAVDAETPAEMQAVALFTLLRGFDEWTLARVEDGTAATPEEFRAIADHQFRLVRRLLAAG